MLLIMCLVHVANYAFSGEKIHLSSVCLETGANLSIVIIDMLPE